LLFLLKLLVSWRRLLLQQQLLRLLLLLIPSIEQQQLLGEAMPCVPRERERSWSLLRITWEVLFWGIKLSGPT
ncbi:unnamed protein product, partial [Musa hybrid cultivar]